MSNVRRAAETCLATLADSSVKSRANTSLKLLDGLEGYLRSTTSIIEQYPDGEQKNALIAQSAAIASLLDMARVKADRL